MHEEERSAYHSLVLMLLVIQSVTKSDSTEGNDIMRDTWT